MKYQDEILLFKKLVYISQRCRTSVIRKKHDDPTAEHFEIKQTIEQITREYYFPEIHRKMKRHIQKCNICNKAKTGRHLPYRKLQPIPLPVEP